MTGPATVCASAPGSSAVTCGAHLPPRRVIRFDGNYGGAVNYEADSFGGPLEDPRFTEPPLKLSGDADRHDHCQGNDDYIQPGNLIRLAAVNDTDMYRTLPNLSIVDFPAYHQIGHGFEHEFEQGDASMLTLVQRQPRIATVSWDKVIHLCRRTRELAAAWGCRARQRDALSRLDDRLLADIGLTREEQMLVCSKLFWWWP